MANRFLALLFFCFFIYSSFGQKPQSDTAFVAIAANAAKEIYVLGTNEQTHLYNGSEYKEYRSLKGEHPYFISNNWVTGSIFFDGEQYDQVALLYNCFTDCVVSKKPPSSIAIELVKEKVKSFQIAGHTFVLMNEKPLPSGFYDLLFDGATKVYAKRVKEFQENISSTEIQHVFIEKSKYFISKDKSYFSVWNKKSVLNVLKDKRPELKHFMRQDRLRFRKNREQAIVKMVEFYSKNQ